MSAPAAAIQETRLSASVDGASVKTVRETLQGPVIQTLRRLIPELGQASGEAAYDLALANIPLLDTCFKTFRAQRDRFNHILKDKSGRVVGDDTGLLACGHNLEVVIAMIVRTAAKRYFRHHLGLNKKTSGLLGKVRSRLSSSQTKPKGLAEELYDSIKGYLLFEWQVPLVPSYAKLTPAQVSQLGTQLLQYTDAAQLAKATGLPLPADMQRAKAPEAPDKVQPLKLAPPAAAKRMSPPPLAAAPRPVSAIAARAIPIAQTAIPAAMPRQDPGGKKLSGASFAPILELPQVQAATDPALHGVNSVRIIDLVGAKAWTLLILTLGIRRKDHLAVLLLNAFALLGIQDFNRIFGNGANPYLLEKLVENVKPGEISPKATLGDVIEFTLNTFSPKKAASLQ
ncbi:conserved hypothetical protein [Rhodospirillaceae bacterium LM-1]|nr:conserved hypothetical protein [Rhodospirillaceae bacterium LM-1]